MKYLDTKQASVEEAISQAMGGVVAKDLLEAGGKYLKYSDLLLQKGRLMAKGANTAMIDKEISKEMKKLGIKESKDEYEKFFNSALKKFKIDSPADLKTDAKKKEFFNYVDKNYKGKEEETNLEEGKMKELAGRVANVVMKMKKDRDMKGFADKFKKDVMKSMDIDKSLNKVLPDYIAGKDIAALMKEDTMNKNVDETLDKIREANVAKQKSMREILADIWNMGEGKNVFEKTVKESPFDSKRQLKDPKKETMVMMKKGNYKGKVFVIDKKDLPKFERQGAIQVENKEEGFASDAQRRAAFASGYKEKGKKKKEEVEKDGKTATGQKPTKVEIEPEVK